MSNEFIARAPAPVSRAGAKEWWGLAILAMPCLLYSMDLTVLNLAIPQIAANLSPTAAQLLWIVDIYGFFLAGALVTMGSLGDRIGRRRLLLIGAAAFGAASAMAAFSSTAMMLIFSRALLGLAAATLAPSTLSLIRSLFQDERQRGFAVGVWMASFSIGGAIGPLAGGLLLDHFWWGSVLLIPIPMMIVLLVIGPSVLPEERGAVTGSVDLPSAGLSISAMLAVVYGVKHLAVGDASAMTLAALGSGVLLGWTFMRRQGLLRSPMLDLSLFKSSGFSGALLINLTAFFLAFGTLLFLAQHLQLVLGMSALEAGLWTLPSAAGFLLGSLVGPVASRSVSAAQVMTLSLTLAAGGFGLLGAALAMDHFGVLLAGAFVFSLGLAPVFTLSAAQIMSVAPSNGAGSAAAAAEISSELGGALGIAVFGSLLAAVYRLEIERALPANLPAWLSDRILEGIGPAAAALSNIDGALGTSLRHASVEAYSAGFIAVAVVSAAVAGFAALIANRLRSNPSADA